MSMHDVRPDDKKIKRNMTVQIVLILVIIGLAAGMLSGLIGVGGGIIVVPALVYFLGFSQYEAQGKFYYPASRQVQRQGTL